MKLFLFLIPFALLISCDNIVMSAGTLGGLTPHSIDGCEKEIVLKELDSLSQSSELIVPDSLVQFVKWDEQGFDFLRHWTIYTEFENTPYLIWFSVIEDTVFKVSVRASFDFSSQKWVYSKDLDSQIANQVDKVFILAFLNKLKCR